MATRTTTAPAAIVGAMVSGGTHGYPRWTGTLVTIANYEFVATPGVVAERCAKCSNSGHIAQFAHVLNGVCFDCNGKGLHGAVAATVEDAQEVIRKRLMAAAARQRRAARDEAAKVAEGTAWAAANADLAAALITLAAQFHGDHDLLDDLPDPLVSFCHTVNNGKPLTPGQATFAHTLLAEHTDRQITRAAADAAKARTVHLGALDEKITVTGTVKVNIEIESHYGYRATYSRMVVVADVDGNEVKTYSAAQWARGAKVGDTVTLVGTVKEHDSYDGVAQTLLTPHQADHLMRSNRSALIIRGMFDGTHPEQGQGKQATDLLARYCLESLHVPRSDVQA